MICNDVGHVGRQFESRSVKIHEDPISSNKVRDDLNRNVDSLISFLSHFSAPFSTNRGLIEGNLQHQAFGRESRCRSAQAYHVLHDPEQRKCYDDQRDARAFHQGGGSKSGLSNIVSTCWHYSQGSKL